jgi:hypothetical protein
VEPIDEVAEVNAEVPAEDDLGEIPPPTGLMRSDGYVTFAEGDPEAYRPLAGFPAEDDLGEIPPRPTWAQCPRLISDYDENGYIARTQEEMDAVLAERDAREAAQPIAEHPVDFEDEVDEVPDDLGVFNDPPPPMVRCYSNMGTDFALPEPEYLLAMAAYEAEQAAKAADEAAAHEAAEWTAFLKERQQKKCEWNKLHGLSWNEFEDDELPDGDVELEYRKWRLARDETYRDGYEFQVTPAQEKLYLEFRTTVIERGRWTEPGLAELRNAWGTFLAERGLEIVLG